MNKYTVNTCSLNYLQVQGVDSMIVSCYTYTLCTNMVCILIKIKQKNNIYKIDLFTFSKIYRFKYLNTLFGETGRIKRNIQ